MFNFFKRKNDFKLVSPVKGQLINLDKVNDQVFSSKIMGDGFAVIPEEQIICSPINGKVMMVFPTKHAIGLKTSDGQDVIIHVAVNTVELNGFGFSVFVKEGDIVKQGQKLVELGNDIFHDSAIDLVTIVVLPNSSNLNLPLFDKSVERGEGVI